MAAQFVAANHHCPLWKAIRGKDCRHGEAEQEMARQLGNRGHPEPIKQYFFRKARVKPGRQAEKDQQCSNAKPTDKDFADAASHGLLNQALARESQRKNEHSEHRIVSVLIVAKPQHQAKKRGKHRNGINQRLKKPKQCPANSFHTHKRAVRRNTTEARGGQYVHSINWRFIDCLTMPNCISSETGCRTAAFEFFVK